MNSDKGSSVSATFKNKAIRLTAPVLAVAGWLLAIAPGMAASYNNDYRVCAGRVIGEGVTAQAASQGCAGALRPRDLAACVVYIKRNTEIAAPDALSACNQARRPKDYASCVAGISKNTEGAVNPDVLTYCNRSLLPVRFAQCVVGLRSETDLTPIQALNTCIDGSDRIGGLPPSSILLPTRRSTEFSPTFETNPIPENPESR
ncbi:hypothetical protein [Halotia branconii]|uniref:Uncharacterized protein n=1 Tax=Halotia branconii CENA392 TaxID=1539056 RepID=A0AAJ6NUD8_9CYAN|nr:hypothetical protein [Halotia branconii]WGV26893.1 hypothetical protein QI031_05165 [Halotia branconii CENA392]